MKLATSTDSDTMPAAWQKSELSDTLLSLWESMKQSELDRQDDPRWAENNLEYDLRTSDWIVEKVRERKGYAQNLYAALCNNEWQKIDVIQILMEESWSCSMRYAGEITAHLCGSGTYLDWYCSRGIGDGDNIDGFVAEGVVTDEVMEDFKKLGWRHFKGPDDYAW